MISPKEIARDRGKPLSKYERNVMIFDWLHTLDETATAAAAEPELQQQQAGVGAGQKC